MVAILLKVCCDCCGFLYVWGSGASLPHARRNTTLPPRQCKKCSRTPYLCLSTVLFIHAQAGILVHPHAGIVGCCCSRPGAILVLLPSFFPYGPVSGEAVSFPHGLRGGFCVVIIYTADWELYSFIPICSCMLFSQTGMVV